MQNPIEPALREALGPLAPVAARLPRAMRILLEAFFRLSTDDGWAIASHIALSTLMSLFPFLIVVTALAGFVGSKSLADEAARLLLGAWPVEVAEPIANEIRRVATAAQGRPLTVGVVFSVYFASSAIESLRIGLNRAYEVIEKRRWWLLRLVSIVYVILSAIALLVLSVLVVLGPLITATVAVHFPWMAQFDLTVTIVRFGIATLILAVTLFMVHYWLPAGKRRPADIVPGIAVTLVLWLAAGAAFGAYLSAFANQYVLTYAGLASVMIALVFLYFSAAIFLFGGEINAAFLRARQGIRGH